MRIELLGASSPESDAEVLSLANDFLRALNIETVLHLNTLGTPQSRASYVQKLRDYLEPNRNQLSEDSQKRLDLNPLRIFDSKMSEIEYSFPARRVCSTTFGAKTKNRARIFKSCGSYLDALGITYEVDHALVRGFDYYTRTAFEFVSDKLGAQSTVLGGGRYDGLVEELGGTPTPGIGFGSGIERLLLVREASGIEEEKPQAPTAF